MSSDPDESDDFNLPLEEDVVSTGAAADSAARQNAIVHTDRGHLGNVD